MNSDKRHPHSRLRSAAAGHLLPEKLRLRCEIRSHSPVIIQMVLRQIRKYPHIHRQSPNPLLLQRMRRHLHHRLRRPRLHTIRKNLQNIPRLRSSMRRNPHLIPHMRLNRPNQHTLPPHTPQHLFQQKRRSSLPIRPRHRTQRELAFRMPKHRSAHLRQRATPMLHQRRPNSGCARRNTS